MIDRAQPAPIPPGVRFEENVPYREGHPLWTLDLYVPETPPAGGPRPAIVVVHGGGWRQGDKGAILFRNLSVHFAQKGFACVGVNYRLTPQAAFPAAVIDVKCAVRWLRAHAGRYVVDTDRIGAMGSSAGGHLTAMLALAGPEAGFDDEGPWRDCSSAVQAAVPLCAPTDFTAVMQPDDTTEPDAYHAFLAGPRESLTERQRAASPLFYVTPTAPPFLIVHGTADPVVPVDQADRLAAALDSAGADVTFLRKEGAEHAVYIERQAEVEPAVEAFFERVLGKAGV